MILHCELIGNVTQVTLPKLSNPLVLDSMSARNISSIDNDHKKSRR